MQNTDYFQKNKFPIQNNMIEEEKIEEEKKHFLIFLLKLPRFI